MFQKNKNKVKDSLGDRIFDVVNVIFMILLAVINGLMAALVWLAGVRFIGDRGLWDVHTYFLPYPLHLLAAWLVFRLAAPAVISGRHGFFKRL